jgi:hypothetical protein
MNREQFAHILRAAAAISNETVFVVLAARLHLVNSNTCPRLWRAR